MNKETDESRKKETEFAYEGKGSLISSECNGYKNYPTWLVSVWMSNDEMSYRYWRSVAQESQSVNALEDAMKDESVEWWNEEHKEE